MRVILFLIIVIAISSCDPGEKLNCQYQLDALIANDTPKVYISNQNDTLIEVKDVVKKDSLSFGLYTFDGKRKMRFYAFFVDGKYYRYSEEYDSVGNLINKEGNILLEFRLFKGAKDTVVFDVSLFSLNKKYEDIELTTNISDTITPSYLYKSPLYSNVKCFSFKLPVAKDIKKLIIYTKGKVINTCTQEHEIFKDTTFFRETNL